MKTFAALACAGLIAGAGMLWFLSNPVVVTVSMKPLQPSAAIPTFKRVPSNIAPQQ
jgi:hypothetical protein